MNKHQRCAKSHQDDPDVLNAVISEQALEVVLHQRIENAQHRRQGVIDELLDRPFEPEHAIDPSDAPLKGAQYSVVATLIDNADPQAATDLAAKAIKDHPNIKCFVGLNAYSTPALLKALEQTQTVGKISADQIFYLMSRGLTENEAQNLVIQGFLEVFTKELPMEYAIEFNRLVKLEMEGSLG